ncbi:hypothetical protein QE363_000689 [Sphingomonas sp. SORGH_AS870]|uniref:hypothetical protein n=1 Tax=Sphingomonas sp. SORGH_AS_0870 TaxID=3041801 RepID=UPI0028642D7E|nr:hypothetical protein [Sphingomonas sp. SORGH_AS_0870]MDR6144896.1 hypothetical protein [Sphingomonas sp. SORGH_AS_0870]
MAPLLSALANKANALSAAGQATVSETRTQLALYQLAGPDARDVLQLLVPAGFALVRLADAGGDLVPDELDAHAVDVELVAAKPVVPDWIYPVVTTAGLNAVIDRAPAEDVVWVHGLDRRIETYSVSWRPWDDVAPFAAMEVPHPSKVVRVLGAGDPLKHIGRWLLRDPDADVSGRILPLWRAHAAGALVRAIAQEVESDGRVLFRGPPPTRFAVEGASLIEVGCFAALQRATGWVYENPRELENRHGLLAAEVSRTALRDGDARALASTMPTALEGARIAYSFGVSQQSRDALKTLSDLRKAVSDETSKLTDATRTMAAAVTTSAVGNVALVIARLTLGSNARFVAPAAVAIGLALAVYVGAVIWSGWNFLDLQRSLRTEWRERLYRFLPDDEYERMVASPVADAERAFVNSAIASTVISVLLLVAVGLVVFRSV